MQDIEYESQWGLVGRAVALTALTSKLRCCGVLQHTGRRAWLYQLGELHAAQGELDLAVQDFQRALAIMDEAGLEERRADCLKAYERALGGRYQANAAAGA